MCGHAKAAAAAPEAPKHRSALSLWLLQGACEHPIAFTDVRLLHARDSQDGGLWPQLHWKASLGMLHSVRQRQAAAWSSPGRLEVSYSLHLGCSQAYRTRRKCHICDRSLAVCMTYGDTCALDSPAFWCQGCYDSLHFDAQGQAIELSHKVFSYVGG